MAETKGSFERLERALEVFASWEDSNVRPAPRDLLEKYPDLREILEPLFSGALLDQDTETGQDDEEQAGETTASPPAGDSEPGGSGKPEQPLDAAPREIGGFRIECELGRGGMGVVYAARQIALDRPVALKVLLGDARLEPRAVARFRRESALLAALDHPSLVEVLTVGRDQGCEYFVMELVDGVPLHSVLRALAADRLEDLEGTNLGSTVEDLLAKSGTTTRPRRPNGSDDTATVSRWHRSYFETAAHIVWQVADALDHAHRAGVLHRDVKSSNILLRADGRAVLTDFGLAREVGRPSLTQSGEFAGTPYYAAPEQILGRARDLDGRVDVFSLGVVLYELLTLRRPFEGETSHQVAEAVLTCDPPEPSTQNRRVPQDLAAVCMRALEKDPRRRYRSAGEFAADLDAFLGRRPVRARRVGPLRRLARFCRREPVKATLALVLLLAVPVIGFLGGYVHARAPFVAAGEAELAAAEIDRLLERATVPLERRQPIALELVRRALELDPGHPDAVGLLVLATVSAHGPEQALTELERIAPTERLPQAALERLRSWLLQRAGRAEVAAALAAALPPPTTAVEAFYDGIVAHAQHDFEASADALELAVLLGRRVRQVYHLELAHALGNVDRPARSRQVANALTMLWPDSSNALYWAYFAERRTMPERAWQRLGRAVELEPDNPFHTYNYGTRLLESGRSAEAVPPLRRATTLLPTMAEAHSNLAHALLETGQTAEALQAIDRALAIAPDEPKFHANRGQVLRNLEQTAGAMAAFRHALALDPEQEVALTGLLRLLVATEGHAACRDFCREQLAAGRTCPVLHRQLVLSLFALGDRAGALAAANAGTERYPDDARLLTRRALLLQRSDPEQAIADAEQAVASDPELGRAWGVLGMLRCTARDFAGALDALRRRSALEPENPSAWLNIAIAHRAAGHQDEALVALRALVERFPNWPDGHNLLADCLLDRGEPTAALAVVEAGLQRLPSDDGLARRLPSVLAAVATSHRAAGRAAEARAAAERGLEALGDRTDAEAGAARARLEALRDG